MLYFLRNLPWLLANSRKYPGLLSASFRYVVTGSYSRPM